jgi:hypothetical protein
MDVSDLAISRRQELCTRTDNTSKTYGPVQRPNMGKMSSETEFYGLEEGDSEATKKDVYIHTNAQHPISDSSHSNAPLRWTKSMDSK